MSDKKRGKKRGGAGGKRDASKLEGFRECPSYRGDLIFSKQQMLVFMPGFSLPFPGHFELTYQIESIP